MSDTRKVYQKHDGHRMSPYSKNGQKKYRREKVECTNIWNTTHAHKEEVRNANRSLKKGVRQQLKRELEKELDFLTEQAQELDLGY